MHATTYYSIDPLSNDHHSDTTTLITFIKYMHNNGAIFRCKLSDFNKTIKLFMKEYFKHYDVYVNAYRKMLLNKCVICNQLVDKCYNFVICNICTRTCVNYDTCVYIHKYQFDSTLYVRYDVGDITYESVVRRGWFTSTEWHILYPDGRSATMRVNDTNCYYKDDNVYTNDGVPLPITICDLMIQNCDKLFDRFYKRVFVMFVLGYQDVGSVISLCCVPKDVLQYMFEFVY